MASQDIFDFDGKKVGQLELNDIVFSAPIKSYLFSEIVNWQRACNRAGTQSALTKADVSGTTKKPFPQKGRGMARQGSLKNPHQIGGGVAFAPKPRDYSYSIPKSKKRAALVSALSLRVKEGRLRLMNDLSFDAPKTGRIEKLLKNFDISSCLLVDTVNDNLKLSARNHSRVKYLADGGINVMDILRYPNLIMTVEAVKKIEEHLVG